MNAAANPRGRAGGTSSEIRTLGWGRFALQLTTVLLAFVAASVLPVLALGETSASVALSALSGVVGGLAVAAWWLRRDGALGEALDLSRPQSWPRTLAAAIVGTGVIMLIFALGAPTAFALGLDPPNVEGVLGWVTQNPYTFIIWVVLVAWGSAAFGEELLWRGFLIDRLSRLSGLRGRTTAILLVHAVLFGLPHLYQGWGGVLITGVIGLFLGWLRLRMHGNLWAPIIAHGLVDTIMLSAGYIDSLGWYTAEELT